MINIDKSDKLVLEKKRKLIQMLIRNVTESIKWTTANYLCNDIHDLG